MNAANPADQAAIAARIGVAARLLSIPADTLVQHLIDVTSGVLLDPVVFSDADLRTFAVGTAIGSDDTWLARRAAQLAAGISGSKALARAAAARRGDVWIERALGRGGSTAAGLDGVSATVAIAGTATLDDDLAAIGAIGASSAAVDALAARLRMFEPEVARRDRLVRITVYSGPSGRDTTIELGAQLGDDALAKIRASDLHVSAAQLRLLDQVHPILAGGRPAWLRCGIAADALEPHATLMYPGATLDNALRVVGGLANESGAESRFGTFAGALGAGRARAIELAIGPHDPIRMRVGLPVAPTA
jgi:hypothetical protein